MNNNYDVYMCRKPQSAFELAAEMRQKEGFEDYDYGAIAKCPDGDEWLERMQNASEKLGKSLQAEILSNFKKAAIAKFFDDGYQNSNPTKTHGIPPKHMTHHLPHQPENNVGLFYYKEKRSWLDRLMEMIPRRFTS
jgi:hypothetical protein